MLLIKSTLAAETVARSDTADDEIYISDIVSELLFNGTKSLPIEIYIDSKSLYDAITSKKNVLEKRLKTDIAMLRERCLNEILLQIFTILVQNTTS